jgi:hypothetical protein
MNVTKPIAVAVEYVDMVPRTDVVYLDLVLVRTLRWDGDC